MDKDRGGLGEPAARGAHILDPGAHERRQMSWRQRLRGLVKRPWVWVAVAFTVVSTLAAFLNTSLDLLERFDRSGDGGGAPLEGAVSAERSPGDPESLILWSESQAVCEDIYVDPLTQDPVQHDVRPGDGELGIGVTSGPAATTNSWVLDGAYRVPASKFDQDEFLAAGAVLRGTRNVEVILSNRRDRDIVITNLTADIERRPAFGGTVMHEPGGDPMAVRLLILDLAEERPVAMTLDDLCEPYPFFARYKLAVGPGEAEVLAVRTHPAEGCYCAYRLKIEYWYDGTRHSATVPADGEPPLESMGESLSGYDLIYTTGSGGDLTRYDCRRDPAACTDLATPG